VQWRRSSGFGLLDQAGEAGFGSWFALHELYFSDGDRSRWRPIATDIVRRTMSVGLVGRLGAFKPRAAGSAWD
jgi:hypothetical protein